MENAGHRKRPRRIPLSHDEVAEIIAYKKRKEHERLTRFKKSRQYKILNIFNLACFFIYFELLFCFYGPCVYENLIAIGVEANYGEDYDKNGKPEVRDVELSPDGKTIYRLRSGSHKRR